MTDKTELDQENLVTWNGPNDLENPKNWTMSMKWRMTLLASAFNLVAPISTSMTAPALLTIAKDLEIRDGMLQNMTLSAYLLGGAFGSLLSGPLCEIYGRRPILQIFNILYLVFNTLCGFANNGAELIVFRVFAGLGGSAGMVIGAGVLGDLWTADQRGLSVSIYTVVSLLGPTLGPLLGGFITQYSSWRWSFWCISIAGGITQVFAYFYWRESFAPILLRRKAQTLRAVTGNPELRTKWEQSGYSFSLVFKKAVVRPFVLLGTQPIFQILCFIICYTYGVMYLALATFAALWTDIYHESVSISGLNYLALAIGYIIGTQTCTRFIDTVYKRLKTTKGNGIGAPEYRLPIMLPGGLIMPIGLLWYGWSAQQKLHWIMPDLGMVIFGIGVKYNLQSVQLYALDVYPTYAASANAASSFLRSLFGFGFPLFAPALYKALHFGWGNTLLAGLALLVGIPAPIFLWFCGPALRRRSPYAVGD